MSISTCTKVKLVQHATASSCLEKLGGNHYIPAAPNQNVRTFKRKKENSASEKTPHNK
jgi:hypothetical protein